MGKQSPLPISLFYMCGVRVLILLMVQIKMGMDMELMWQVISLLQLALYTGQQTLLFSRNRHWGQFWSSQEGNCHCSPCTERQWFWLICVCQLILLHICLQKHVIQRCGQWCKLLCPATQREERTICCKVHGHFTAYSVIIPLYFSMSLGGPVDQGLLEALEAAYNDVKRRSFLLLCAV